MAARRDDEIGQLHEPRRHLARHGRREHLHEVCGKPDASQLRPHARHRRLGRSPGVRRRRDDDRIAALERHHGFVDGRRLRVRRGRDGRDDTDGLRPLHETLLGDLLDDARGLRAQQIAQRAEGFALVLDDLTLDIADAGHLDGQFRIAARRLGLVDGPRERGDSFVDAGLAFARDLVSEGGHGNTGAPDKLGYGIGG